MCFNSFSTELFLCNVLHIKYFLDFSFLSNVLNLFIATSVTVLYKNTELLVKMIFTVYLQGTSICFWPWQHMSKWWPRPVLSKHSVHSSTNTLYWNKNGWKSKIKWKIAWKQKGCFVTLLSIFSYIFIKISLHYYDPWKIVIYYLNCSLLCLY